MTVLWFTSMAALGVAGFMVGNRLGRGNDRRAWLTMLVALGLITLWAWLLRNPSIAVRAIPVWMLSHIEGVGAVPLFMIITGVAWSRAQHPHQKRVTVLAAFFGGLFFLQGSLWMLQTTPRNVLGGTHTEGAVTMQTQDFTCVPAACATALNRLGIPTTEAEMAELTQTRPGTGSTLIRALDGLSTRLAGTGYAAELVEPRYEDLATLKMPVLTPLQYEPQKLHMVAILSVRRGLVRIADPESGIMYLSPDEFKKFYTGRAIHFVRR